MDIENYYTVLAMLWMGWLLVLPVQCVWLEALHDKVIVKSRCVWDTEYEWVLKDSKGKEFKLVSEGSLRDREIILIVLFPFLLPVFGTYYAFSNKSLNAFTGCLLSTLLFISIPIMYNLIDSLSFSLSSSGLFIGFK